MAKPTPRPTVTGGAREGGERVEKQKLTEPQQFALTKCPRDKWFRAGDLPPVVRAQNAMLGRLADKGYLERRVNQSGGWMNLFTEYRVLAEA
jgi:hypothetical protein